MLLAGDIGATKTLLGVFDPQGRRPRAIATRSFGTLDYSSFPAMLEEFSRVVSLGNTPIESACFGIAGPILGDTAQLTNADWESMVLTSPNSSDSDRIELLNDLQAMAYAVPVLNASEVQTLQAGEADPRGNIALIAAGTGLGEALLHNVDGRYTYFVPSGSRTCGLRGKERARDSTAALVDSEVRTSRCGTRRIRPWPHQSSPGCSHEAVPCDRRPGQSRSCRPRHDGGTRAPVRIVPGNLEMFVEAYGAEAGNLALRSLSTGGLFVGGGIAPKILPAMTDGRFMRAFLDKAPFDALLAEDSGERSF